jgi:hypothetical protein
MRVVAIAATFLWPGLAVGACLPPSSASPHAPTTVGASEKAANGEASIDENQPMGGKSADAVDTEMHEAPPIPLECASTDPCVPDPAFVKRLCNGAFPDVALVLMGKTPFAHMFLRADVDGWNADGGSSARARLLFDEEVLVLKRRTAPTNTIVVGSGASFLVMRWDGNCYTLDEGELTPRHPPTTKNGPVPWRYYSDRTKEALLKSAKVASALERRGKECKGATSGDVSRGCEQADAALSAAVVAEVRGGLPIPNPDRRP